MLKATRRSEPAACGRLLKLAEVVPARSGSRSRRGRVRVLDGAGVGRRGGRASRLRAAGSKVRRYLSHNRAVDAAGVLARIHSAGLAAVTAVLEALAARAVAALREPELTCEGGQLAVLGRHGSLRHVRTSTVLTVTTVAAMRLEVSLVVAVRGAVHRLQHFLLEIRRTSLGELLLHNKKKSQYINNVLVADYLQQ